MARASGLNFVLCVSAVQFSRIGGRCFRGISTIGGGAFGGYMPAGQKGMRAEPFFALTPLNFHEAGGQVLVDRYPRRRRFWYMHASGSGGRTG